MGMFTVTTRDSCAVATAATNEALARLLNVPEVLLVDEATAQPMDAAQWSPCRKHGRAAKLGSYWQP